MVEWVERLSPVLVGRGIRTHGFESGSIQTNVLEIDTCRILAWQLVAPQSLYDLTRCQDVKQ